MCAVERNTAAWQDPLQMLAQGDRIPVEQFVTFQINQLSTAFERQWTRILRAQAGINLSQWRILAVLEAGPSGFSELVEATGIDKALLSRSMHQLQSLGLVAIAASGPSGKGVSVALTVHGRRLLATWMPVALRRQRHLLAALTASERRAFYGAVEKLKRAAAEWSDSG